MTETHLIVDVSALAYRSLYAMGDLSHEGVRTGVLFGVFRTVIDLTERFAASGVAWCFDRGHAGRSEIYPGYKAGRKERTEEEWKALGYLRDQLKDLHREHLLAIGYRNVFGRKGYEADDVIASACLGLDRDQNAVIVGNDSDLWQLLRDGRVTIWNGKTTLSEEWLVGEYGVAPSQWADVKAIAGCGSDGVEGIRGVGEKTAAKFLSGKLKPESKAFRSIVTRNDVWRRNLPLVRLPFPGVGRFELERDGPLDWGPTLRRLGMASLEGRGMAKGRMA